MPQKKNPDVAELIRGKSGRVYGDLVSILTTMKVFEKMIETMKFNKDKMQKGAGGGFTNATDAADYLVRKGIPFREAHEIIGKMVLYATKHGKALDEFTIEEFKGFSDKIGDDVYEAINLSTCVNNRNIIGGPSEKSVLETICADEKFIEENF